MVELVISQTFQHHDHHPSHESDRLTSTPHFIINRARLSALHHQKSLSLLAAGDDLEGRIAAHPCSAEYAALEVCLGEHDRSWAVCRSAVLALRACDSKVKASSVNVESSS
jgi:hypothetical protein